MPNTTSAACVPVRVKMRLQAIGLWAFLSIPSIVVTILLFVWTIDGEKVRFLQTTLILFWPPLTIQYLLFFWAVLSITRIVMTIGGHTCHKLQFNRKKSLHPLEAKRVQLLCISSHIENGFLFERENSDQNDLLCFIYYIKVEI